MAEEPKQKFDSDATVAQPMAEADPDATVTLPVAAPDAETTVSRPAFDPDATVNPDQIEVCGDSFDNDCDGLFDWADTLTCNVDTVLPASWYGCGGGCDQSGVPAGGIAGVLAGLLVIRRRRT